MKAAPTSVPITAAFVILLVGPEMVPVISLTSVPRASLPEASNDTGAAASAYVRTPDAFGNRSVPPWIPKTNGQRGIV